MFPVKPSNPDLAAQAGEPSEAAGRTHVVERGVTRLLSKAQRQGNEVIAIRNTALQASSDQIFMTRFRGMLGELKSCYHGFLAKWEDVIDYCESESLTPFPTSKDTVYYENVKTAYYDALGHAKLLFESPDQSRAESRPSQESNQTIIRDSSTLAASIALRSLLPDSNIRPFSGAVTEWQNFKSTFTSLVAKDSSLTNCEKFHFLRKLVQGSAFEVIENIPVADETFEQAWEALKRVFDNPRRLASFHLEKLLCYKPPVGKPYFTILKDYMCNVTEIIKSLKKVPLPPTVDLMDYIFCELALRHMDTESRQAFELGQEHDTFPTFEKVTKFFEHRVNAFRVLHNSTTPKGSTSVEPKAPKPSLPSPNRFQTKSNSNLSKNKNSFFTSSSPNKSKPPSLSCGACGGPHIIMKCETFLSSDPNRRIYLLRKWKGCRNCLCPLHATKDCKSLISCKECSQRHHTTLHLPVSITTSDNLKHNDPPKTADTPQQPPPKTCLSGFTSSNTNLTTQDVLLGTAIGYVKNSQGYFIPLRLVLDSGSQESFITKGAASSLGLRVSSHERTMLGVNGSPITSIDGRVNITIRGSTSPELFETSALVVPEITSNLPTIPVPDHIRAQFTSHNVADPNFWRPSPVSLLLGADVYPNVITGTPSFSHSSLPYTIDSVFGQIIIGRYTVSTPSSSTLQCFFTTKSLSNVLEQFWKIEEVKPTDCTSPEDKKCEEHFKTTHRRDESGRYVVRQPFINEPRLGPSRPKALKRLLNLEAKLSKKPELRAEYNDFMAEYLSLGHMSPATSPGLYYIPHHCVVKETQGKIKIRVVFDGSSKTSSGSLNDYLLTGPNLLNSIADIILNFRKHRFALCADIVKFYRQISMNPLDRPYQTILWREDPAQPVQEYFLNTVTYGLSASPYLALRAVKQLIEDEGSMYPMASKALSEDIYVDDIVTGANTIREVLQLKHQLLAMLRKGALELSKWSSNLPQALDESSTETQATVTLTDEKNGSVKLLGLHWEPTYDQFQYVVKQAPCGSSKRVVLSTIGRLYDPVGFLTPVTFHAKVIMQRTWQHSLCWDDNLPSHLLSQWEQFVQDLPAIQKLKIPRFIPTSDATTTHIVGFCDSSELGYCACLYLWLETPAGISTSLITGKSKLAPLKNILSIPKLELCAALLLCRLYESTVKFRTDLKISRTILFTDSTIVLSWLRTPPHLLKTFVAHRVVEILNHTDLQWWYHIRSEQNSADCGSRGLMPTEIINHQLWWHGPTFLSQAIDSWPLKPFVLSCSELPEIKSQDAIVLIATKQPSFYVTWMDRFSSLTKLIRSTAYLLRFLRRFKGNLPPSSLAISGREYLEARNFLIRRTQEHFYPSLVNASCSDVPASLNCLIDSSGICRVGGRLRKSNLPYQEKFPILVPRTSHLAILLIDYLHVTHCHAGPATLQAILHRDFWIPSSRSLIRSRKFKCIRCYKLSRRPDEPFMADLPTFRFDQVRPFYRVGVDFAGPFICRESLRRKAPETKVYMALFICLSTKAIHLELVPSLSTEGFLDSLDRFIARRGVPATIVSDRGTNFVGCSRYLSEVSKWLCEKNTSTTLEDRTSAKGIEWIFNPPSSPHFGGIWESAVKMAKSLCTKTLGTYPFTKDELNTIFAKVEAVLNSRPLTPLSSDVTDLSPLTPGHFIIGTALTALPETPLSDIPSNRLNRWQYLRQCTQRIWTRWQREYLHTLQQRRKWTNKGQNLQIGELVLVTDANHPPLQWPLARILEVHPGDDGVVRVATIRTKSGEYVRPVVKLVPLTPITTLSSPETIDSSPLPTDPCPGTTSSRSVLPEPTVPTEPT